MAQSPAHILQRIKQLKMWQENHEELLKKAKLINTTASDYHTIEGLSAFDSSSSNETSPRAAKSWDSQVISPTKSFDELLEEKLAEDPGPESVAPKPKRPFLRKGAGLQRFKMKKQTPQQATRRNVRRTKSETSLSSTVTPLRVPDLSIKPKATWCRVDDAEERVRKINAIAQADKSDPRPGEQTLYEKALEKELMIFEALEQRADNSSFCSTNSSVLRILSSTPSKTQPTISEEKRVHWESSHSEDEAVIETNLERKDIAEILLRLKSLVENDTKTNTEQLPPVTVVSEEEKWSSTPTTDASSSDNSSVESADLEVTLKTEKRDVGVGTCEQFSDDFCAICGDKLHKKISEYEEKIRDVLDDKNVIGEIKRELEKKEKDFLKKRREFENERQDLLFEMESEKKKLSKERQAFQMYMKESQNRPNKKERQEISRLKQEVADLTETLKLKESKNGMTQARLRNQVRQLERESSNLKDEIERLTKENAKLSAAQKLNRKSSDSKILHEINKNITKLTQQTSSKKVEESEEDDDDDENDARFVRNKSATNDKEENVFVQYRNRSSTNEGGDAHRSLQKRNISMDKEDSLLEMGAKMNKTHLSLEDQYENTFRNMTVRDVTKTIDNIERTLEDGSKEKKYANGNVKIVSSDGNLITIKYFNGDKQETDLLNGTIKYNFMSKNICQTTYADGLEVVEFPEGVIEKRHTDGKCEITLPDGVVQTTFPDGSQETRYKDGSVVKINKDGDKILLLPNGQKEIETKQCKRREYPDGTVKILYPDGTQETKYSNGRIRIKDANGTLVMDMKQT